MIKLKIIKTNYIKMESVESLEIVSILDHINIAFLITQIFLLCLYFLEFCSYHSYSCNVLLISWS
jgi:hypothetical protein